MNAQTSIRMIGSWFSEPRCQAAVERLHQHGLLLNPDCSWTVPHAISLSTSDWRALRYLHEQWGFELEPRLAPPEIPQHH